MLMIYRKLQFVKQRKAIRYKFTFLIILFFLKSDIKVIQNNNKKCNYKIGKCIKFYFFILLVVKRNLDKVIL